MSSGSIADVSSPGSDRAGTRSRLLLSLALAVAFGVVWGPFCAFANLLRADAPTVFFSPSRYVFLTTSVCTAVALAGAAAMAVGLLLTMLVWRLFGQRSRPWFICATLGPVALLALQQLGVKVSGSFIVTGVLLGAIVWCLASAYFDRADVQVAVLLVAPLPGLLYLADLTSTALAVLGVVCLAYPVHRQLRANPLPRLGLDATGMTGLTTLFFAVVLHVRVGHFVPALDLPYVLAFLGILVLALSALVLAATGRGRRWIGGAAALLCAAGLVGSGLTWARHPPDPQAHGSPSDGRPNIVLIVWDTVRAQQVHQYGYGRNTTPTLGALAEAGALFDRATAPSCWTLPSHASMFTGLLPRTHAACSGGYLKLAGEHQTIAELLGEAGYETLGLSGNYYWVSHGAGTAQGFQQFVETRLSAEVGTVPALIVKRLLYPHDQGAVHILRGLRRWLLTRPEASKPAFVFVNLFEPHVPYKPKPEFLELSPGVTPAEAKRAAATPFPKLCVEGAPGGPAGWQALRDLYDGDIRYTDETTGGILDLLGSGLGDEGDLLTIVTSDHGENLGEHDLASHTFSVHETLLHVPLVLRWPGHMPEGVRVRERVSLLDIFATIAEAAGLPRSQYAEAQSSSLVGIAQGKTEGLDGRAIVAEVWPYLDALSEIRWAYMGAPAPQGRFMAPTFALYDGDWKYMRAAGQERELLYNTAEDPAEENDLSAREPIRCARMSAMLDEWLEETPNRMPTFADGFERGPLRD